jgi:hypothetical protein
MHESGDKPMTDTTYLDDQGRYVETCVDPPVSGDETATLLGFLERQRATFAWKVSGLDAAALRQTLPPSAMTLGGMLKHLARFEDDMSHEWVLGQGQLPPWSAVDWETDRDWDWRTAAEDSPEELRARWLEAVARSRQIFANEIAASGRGESARDAAVARGQAPPLRYVLLNMIEEYARHNGHADLIRESIDGLTGHDPPGASG